MVINTQSCPQPRYNPSSILVTLGAFSSALDELRGRRSDVKLNYMDQNALGPNPVQTDVVHHFAEMLSGDIFDAAVRKQDTQFTNDCAQICHITQSEGSSWTMSDQEQLAKWLAAEIYSNALKELGRHVEKPEEQPDVFQTKQTYEKKIIGESDTDPASYICSPMHHCDLKDTTMETNNTYHRRSTTNSTSLDDMSHLGSLDYPDAPPSTPLLPEMLKSRASFTRKLKDGLAKEFLPSTPPSTPKDQQLLSEDKMPDSHVDKSEFMVRLMRSLSLVCLQVGVDNGAENESRFQSKILDYAAQLSADIIHCITAAQADSKVNIETPVRDVQVLAAALAEKIIITSTAEVMRSMRVDGTSQEAQASTDTVLSESITDIPPVEALKAMAGRIITNTLVQTFSQLGSVSLPHATSKQLPDPASDPVPWEQGNDRYLNTGLHINSYKTQTNGCSHVKSEFDYIPSNFRTGTVELIFAENLVHKVFEHSIKKASTCRLKSKQKNNNPEKLSFSVASQAAVRAFVSETLCRDTQELQCVLLWAAASQMGTSTLQIDLSDKHIQEQV